MSATAIILAANTPIQDEWKLLSIAVQRELNRIPTAWLEFADETNVKASGPVKKSPFGISDTATFLPGTKIEIKLRHEDGSREASVFKGVVVRHSIAADASGARLSVEVKDEAVQMSSPRKHRIFASAKDSDVLGKLAQEAGLSSAIAATQAEHPELVQFDCTDWDFAVARAEANGLVLIAENGKLLAKKIALSGSAKFTFDFDEGLVDDLEMEMNGGGQISSAQSIGWDVAKQEASVPAAGAEFPLSQSDLKGQTAAGNLGFPVSTLRHPVPALPDELQAWADGSVARSRLSFLRGRFSAPGLGALALLDVVKLQNMGTRFNGETLVTGLRHSLDDRGWRTDVQFGLSAQRMSERADFQGPPSAGLLPAARGFQIGVVKKITEDPLKQFRIQVHLATMDAATGLIWARWASPQASRDFGCFFLPNVGDEVVVGFLNDDPRHPVVVGSLFSSKNAPPAPYKEIDEKNLYKGFVTAKGTKLAFVDQEKPSISIETPGGNKAVLDDDAETITLTDKNKNSITLSKDGIEIKSAKDLKLEASGNVTIKGSKVDVQ